VTVHCCVCVNVAPEPKTARQRKPIPEATQRVGSYEVCDQHVELLQRNHEDLISALMEIRRVKRCGPRNAT
jgi:hypothetical protein